MFARMRLRSVLLLGATGLVGRELLDLLVRDEQVDEVIVLARRSTGVASAKLREEVGELGEMARHRALFAADAIFCALGTTMKSAGSKERFRQVDFDYPLLAARLGIEAGARHYLLVSSLGANPRARAFYPRVKGELEQQLIALGYPRTTIARPSFLRGERSEFRPVEHLFRTIGPLLPASMKPVHVRDVAHALVDAAHHQTAALQIIPSREIVEAARRRS